MLDMLSNPYLGFIGLLTAAAGSVVVVSFLIIWAIDALLYLTRFNKALVLAYQEHLKNKREASNAE